MVQEENFPKCELLSLSFFKKMYLCILERESESGEMQRERENPKTDSPLTVPSAEPGGARGLDPGP